MSDLGERALGWAAEALGAPVVSTTRLTGGLTSTMLALTDATGRRAVLRLMTEEPWRGHGSALVERESVALTMLADTFVPAPATLAVGSVDGVAAHLTTFLPGSPTGTPDSAVTDEMAALLAAIHDLRPRTPFRDYESWAWPAKRVVPPWTDRPAVWQRAFEILDGDPPAYEPTLLHRDFSHRNLLWTGARVSGVVDWVETSTGPAWLDAAHAASTLALAHGPEPARAFLTAYAVATGRTLAPHWLVMDAVGFLPAPGRTPLFGTDAELARLDAWLREVVELSD